MSPIPSNIAKKDNGASSEFAFVRSEIIQSFNRVPASLAEPHGLFLKFAGGGKRTPIFWCFNNWAEPVLLSRQLGPDQPLYAMSSLHGIVRGKALKRVHAKDLAVAYADQLLQLAPEGPVLIGGNCQAAPVAEAMAHHVVAHSGRTPLLMTLEHTLFYCYPGSVLMMFGSESHKFNPFLQGVDPLPRWSAQHRRVAWGQVAGPHGRFFVEPGILDLAAFIRATASAFCAEGELRPGEIRREVEALQPLESC